MCRLEHLLELVVLVVPVLVEPVSVLVALLLALVEAHYQVLHVLSIRRSSCSRVVRLVPSMAMGIRTRFPPTAEDIKFETT